MRMTRWGLIPAIGLLLAAGVAASAYAADPLCSGAALTEERMDQCLKGMVTGLSPLGETRGIRPAGTNAAPAASAAPKAVQRAVDLELTFPFGSADLSPAVQANLKLMAHVLNAPDRQQASFQVVGHTDAAGSDELNQALSEQRAHAVAAFLAQQGVDSGRLQASGVGKRDLKNAQDPLAAVNRRVEVVPAG